MGEDLLHIVLDSVLHQDGDHVIFDFLDHDVDEVVAVVLRELLVLALDVDVADAVLRKSRKATSMRSAAFT